MGPTATLERILEATVSAPDDIRDDRRSNPDARRPSSGPRLIERVPHGTLGEPGAILDRFLGWVSDCGLEPYPAQEEALLELSSGQHVVLSTPTGSGKSLVAQGVHFRALCEGKRSFYTAPIKALVSEKFFGLCEQFGAENVGMLTGDASINWGAPIICCTAEILANMAVRQGDATDAPYVVMDEFHYYADRDRGSAWQLPLLLLPRTQFLLMSATLGDTSAIERAIEKRTGRPVSRIHTEQRPVPLDFSYREDTLLETVESLLQERLAPIYIVQFTQKEAADLAQSLTSAKIASADERRAIASAIGDFRFDSPYGRDVRRFIRAGIGIHHAGLLPRYRLLMERLSQRGLLKVICGTDTLGVGVNIPIRTVLFTRLSKFNGEKVALLSVRDFKQIAGRAGRKGFDDRGSVVCQAPEHVVLNKRAAAATRRRGGKRPVKAKPPRGFVAWDEKTFQRLVHSPPETLQSTLRVNHGLLISCLQSEAAAARERGGYRFLVELIQGSHESAARKRRLLRDAATIFRSLRAADVIELRPDPNRRGSTVRVHIDLQSDFSMHETLSLYLVEAAFVLDREREDYALELLSLVEAILEDPKPILYAQERRAKRELMAQLKARRVPYEERIRKLDEVTWPKPGADWIYPTFNLFADKHPWVRSESIRPKSVARAMFEGYLRFEDYVRREEITRVEGLLLRYLGQVHSTMLRSIPESLRTDAVEDVISYLRTTIAAVDSSLLTEWETLVSGADTREVVARDSERELAAKRDPARDPKRFMARVRAEMHRLVRALAARDYEEAARCVVHDPDDPWTAERFAAELAPFHAEYGEVVFDGRARRADRTLLRRERPDFYEVRQVLVDENDDNLWNVEGTIDLSLERDLETPLVSLRRIGS